MVWCACVVHVPVVALVGFGVSGAISLSLFRIFNGYGGKYVVEGSNYLKENLISCWFVVV